MWVMLAGVPGKLKALTDRLTAGRAAKLDHLDADVSSRAPASTALSNAVWTPARAAKLDDIGSSNAWDTFVTSLNTRDLSESSRGEYASGLKPDSTITHGLESTEPLSNTAWTEILNLTGPGSMAFLYARMVGNSTYQWGEIRILLDGQMVMPELRISGSGSTRVATCVPIGAISMGGTANVSDIMAFEDVRFRTSFVISARTSHDSGSPLNRLQLLYRWRKLAS